MFSTHTGNFPIGFRRGWSDWQKDASALIGWAHDHDFGVLDLGRDHSDVEAVTNAGLKIGSIDLLEWQPMFGADADARARSIEKNREFIAAATAKGVRNFFLVVLPADPQAPRSENFGYTTESLGALTSTLEENNARLVIEGYPGRGRVVLHARRVSRAVRGVSVAFDWHQLRSVAFGAHGHRSGALFEGVRRGASITFTAKTAKSPPPIYTNLAGNSPRLSNRIQPLARRHGVTRFPVRATRIGAKSAAF